MHLAFVVLAFYIVKQSGLRFTRPFLSLFLAAEGRIGYQPNSPPPFAQTPSMCACGYLSSLNYSDILPS